ncbi:c-type cytochrome [Campylobacter sp. TTU-622]|nr:MULTISPECIES: c-type cytochrome [unclassified Campylobacter]MBK1971047.1 c-type cytochrome [Campylobacter sp. TTU_617]MBK1973259.1 c-type cytochrome [Campylobacter sp. TTU-622]MBK1991336.1 c-type cytochrome [Campylobacter sp. 2018MI34]
MFRLILLILVFKSLLFGINLKSIFDYTFNTNKEYDSQRGEEIYFQKKCNVCHGNQGEKKFSNSKRLKDMTPEQIKASLIAYTLEPSKTNTQMALYARELSHNDIDNIIAYLKGGDFAFKIQEKELLEEEPPKKTEHGTFIK